MASEIVCGETRLGLHVAVEGTPTGWSKSRKIGAYELEGLDREEEEEEEKRGRSFVVGIVSAHLLLLLPAFSFIFRVCIPVGR